MSRVQPTCQKESALLDALLRVDSWSMANGEILLHGLPSDEVEVILRGR